MKTDPVVQNKRLVRSLQLQIDETLRPLIPKGAPVAHVGYPNYWNVGDSAIWLGTQATLDRLDIKTVYRCGCTDYNRDVMAKCIDGGMILIAGGGNFGDLYAVHQWLRERILQDFPDNPVLQLPQSVWFVERDKLARFQGICEGHPNFHILVREQQSLRKAAKYFSAPASLCPDMAFGLGSLERPTQAVKDIVWLARSDIESTGPRKPPAELEIELQDWVRPGPDDQFFIVRADKYNNRIKELVSQLASNPAGDEGRATELAACYHQLAQLRFRRGLKMLSAGSVVITDRLHGHILCLLMGIPHVVLDNSYKKISGVFEAWTSASPNATFAQSPQQAVREALALVDRHSHC